MTNSFSIINFLSASGVYWLPIESKLLKEGVSSFSTEELDSLHFHISNENCIPVDSITTDIILGFHKKLKIKELKIKCTESIHNGFSSVIKGNSYVFGLNSHDQSNLNSQLNRLSLQMSQLTLNMITKEEFDSIPPITWKTLNSGVVSLTKSEFIKVTDDAEKHIRDKQTQYWIREQRTLHSTTHEDILKIEWS